MQIQRLNRILLPLFCVLYSYCNQKVQDSDSDNETEIEDKYEMYTHTIVPFIDSLGLETNEQYYLIIPISGCYGCVDALLRELKKDSTLVRNSSATSIIFTEFSEDRKVNNAKLGSFYSHGFVYDSTNHLNPLFSFVRAPLLLSIEDGKVVKSDTLSAAEVDRIKLYF